MARSAYVWVVLGARDHPVPFTVKHELVTWLRRHDPELLVLTGTEIWRCRDGHYGEEASRLDLAELLG